MRFSGAAQRASTLARYGLTEEAWHANESTWTRILEAELATRERSVLREYAEEFRTTAQWLSTTPDLSVASLAETLAFEAVDLLPCVANEKSDLPSASMPAVHAPEKSKGTRPFSAPIVGGPVLPFVEPSARTSMPARAPTPLVKHVNTGTAPMPVVRDAPCILPFASVSGGPSPRMDLPVEPPAAGSSNAPSSPVPASVPSASPCTATFTLGQYVMLCAELAANRSDGTLARYGLTSLSLEELHAVWRERLANDQELAARWQALYSHVMTTLLPSP